jgi:hypothetical protein
MEGNSVVLMKKYRLMEKVGSGSFGSIYACTHPLKLGQHLDSKKRYAAKIVRSHSYRKRRARAMANCSTRSNSTNSSRASVTVSPTSRH